jgi:crotonobetainyl-CoA:carnitine CoA-transferase CaiB-like acyl-CoA transferase
VNIDEHAAAGADGSPGRPATRSGGPVARPAPLEGLRIVAVEQYGAGPFGTLLLADLGADVIKVEDPTSGGDVSRYIPPVTQGTDSLFFEAFNRNKRSVLLDLKSDAGREVFERLVASADAVFSNLRGDQPERLRLTYEDLRHVNERIVCVALTGYGRGPADAGLFGYDALVQAEAGWAALTGGPDDPPTKSGLSLADYMTGLVAMVGLLAAVIDARETGRGRDVDTDLFDAALAMLSYPATWYLSAGISQRRLPLSAHPSVVPFGFFATADGHLAVAAPKERFFGDLVRAMDLPELASDERFGDMAARSRNRDALVDVLGRRFAELTTEAWMTRLRGVVPAAPVRSLEEALDDRRLARRGMLAEYEHPTLGHVRSVGVPLFLSGFEPAYRPGPGMGADEASVLEGLGYDATAIDALRERGAFGRPPATEAEAPTVSSGAAL